MAGLDELAPYRTPLSIAEASGATTPWWFIFGFIAAISVFIILSYLIKKRINQRSRQWAFDQALARNDRPRVIDILLKESESSLEDLTRQTSDGEVHDFLTNLYSGNTSIDWPRLTPKLKALLDALT